MIGYIGNTDYDWYQSHLATDRHEVNFWQPSGKRQFRAIQPGSFFFFKLKSPYNAIAGYGIFQRFSILPAWLAWDAFEGGNGCESLKHMQERIVHYRRKNQSEIDHQLMIGCIVVVEPVFFEEKDWIPQPRDWKPNIVQGKTIDLRQGEGERIWLQCQAATLESANLVADKAAKRYSETTTKIRLGQGAFRIGVLENYERACAISNEHSLPVLEAAHIQPYAEDGEHDIRNGILFRSDIHKLFDRGYITVTPDYEFRVSDALRDDYSNGKSYYPLGGEKIRLPKNESAHPSRDLLAWHGEKKYLG